VSVAWSGERRVAVSVSVRGGFRVMSCHVISWIGEIKEQLIISAKTYYKEETESLEF